MYDFKISDARRAYAQKNGIKFTQEDAARHFGVSIGTYRNWEQGRVGLNAGQLSKIADLYETTVDYLLGVTDDSSRGYLNLQSWAHMLPLTTDEEELLNCYRQVEPWERELILNHAKMVVLHAGKDRR